MKSKNIDFSTAISVTRVKNCHAGKTVVVHYSDFSVPVAEFKKMCIEETACAVQFFKPRGVNALIVYKQQM